jgi:hypothetical protein
MVPEGSMVPNCRTSVARFGTPERVAELHRFSALKEGSPHCRDGNRLPQTSAIFSVIGAVEPSIAATT